MASKPAREMILAIFMSGPPYFFRGNQGINPLVRVMYSRYAGRWDMVFSRSAIPETFTNRWVIRIGLKIVHQPPAAAATR